MLTSGKIALITILAALGALGFALYNQKPASVDYAAGDLAECKYAAEKSKDNIVAPHGTFVLDEKSTERFIADCMKAKGWIKKR